MQEYHNTHFFSVAWLFIASSVFIFAIQSSQAQEKQSPCEDKTQRLDKVVCLNVAQTKKLITKKTAPIFPKSCRCLGKVVVYVKVNESGETISAFADEGHPLLRIASVEAVKKWEFNAYQKSGKSIGFIGKVTFLFSPNGNVKL